MLSKKYGDSVNIPPSGSLSTALRCCSRLAFSLLLAGGYGEHVNAVLADLKDYVRLRAEEVERKER